MNYTELSLEQLEHCNGGILMEALTAYKIVKTIDANSKERPINNAISEARQSTPGPFSWFP